ncbi:hypothetical protein N7530_008357 [Penicillium desertorum]|uniref:Uncharacterized protein n=1 Tax=Penicillium desertorum TaxID=1303715 RepID=A0A9W9WNX3_9EURO|nr:hypothetical protein N7530_008357 [Penicillium desertorum]
MQLSDKMNDFRSSSPAHIRLTAAIDPSVASSPIGTMRVKQSDYLLIDLDNIDNKVITREVLPRTEKDYEEALNLFDTFVELHPTSQNPPNLQTSKGFLLWLALNKKGRIEEKPALDTLQGLRRDFQAGMRKFRDFIFTTEHSATLKEYINGPLKPYLSTAEMNKNAFSPNDLMIIMTQLWCRDSLEYRGHPPDRSRVQLSAAMLLYCFTSARTGEVHESTARRRSARQLDGEDSDKILEARTMAACYKHFTLTIEIVDEEPMLVLTYEREFVKGYNRKNAWQIPIHAFYESHTEHMPLMLNLLTFFLPLAVADEAIQDYSSVSAILDAANAYGTGPTRNNVLEVIRFKQEALDTPVFRQYTDLGVAKSTSKARGADSFGKSIVALGYRSGYSQNITIRGCRRWALMEADKKHSETARMKFGGQMKRETFGRSYAHPLSEIDGPANFLGIASREEHIRNRRGMGIYQSFDACQYLPAKAQFEFENREDIRELDSELWDLSDRFSATSNVQARKEIQKRQRSVYDRKKRLYREAVDQIREHSKKGSTISNTMTETLFHYRRRVMPDRSILADLLPRKVSLRDNDGRRALQALETICSEDSPIAYRESLRPFEGKCRCGTLINE